MITRNKLQTLLDQLNKITGREYHLDHNPHYGGYTLTWDKGGMHLIGRVPSKEMFAYLHGALDFVTPDK